MRVFGAGPGAHFLFASVDQGFKAHALFDDRKAHALGAMEFMCAGGDKVDRQPLQIEVQVTNALHRVRMEQGAVLFADAADLPGVQHVPDLVVDQHQADQAGFVRAGQEILQVFQVHVAELVQPDVIRFDPVFPYKCVQGVQNGVMLYF